MSKYIFSISLILLSFSPIFSQDSTAVAKDTIPPKFESYGVRVGVDLYKLTRSIYDKDYKGIELVGDYRLTKNYYIAAEIGNEDKTTDDTQLNFTTKGTYIKFGFDYNAYENWLDMENMVYVGLRYGLSSFNQTLNSYTIYNPNPFFGEVPPIVDRRKFGGLTASWAEVVVGMKAEVFNNLYAGFSFRLNYLVTDKQPDNFENLYIPGFHRTYDGDFGVGFNYTISYFVPFYKSAVKQKEKAEK